MPFSRATPTRQKYLLVRPWDRYLLELPDFAEPSEPEQLLDFSDDEESNCETPPESPLRDLPGGSFGEEGPADSESLSRPLRLVVRLGQPFRALLLAQQRGGEYTRVAAEHNIIAQVKDMTCVRHFMDIRTLEIL